MNNIFRFFSVFKSFGIKIYNFYLFLYVCLSCSINYSQVVLKNICRNNKKFSWKKDTKFENHNTYNNNKGDILNILPISFSQLLMYFTAIFLVQRIKCYKQFDYCKVYFFQTKKLFIVISGETFVNKIIPTRDDNTNSKKSKCI